MDLIAYCNPASIMMSSVSSPAFTDNGSVKLCVYVNLQHMTLPYNHSVEHFNSDVVPPCKF